MSDEEKKLENESPKEQTEREFLHDLSNPLAIAYGNMRILSVKMEKDLNSLSPELILEKLHKALAAFERTNKLLELRRVYIKSKQS